MFHWFWVTFNSFICFMFHTEMMKKLTVNSRKYFTVATFRCIMHPNRASLVFPQQKIKLSRKFWRKNPVFERKLGFFYGFWSYHTLKLHHISAIFAKPFAFSHAKKNPTLGKVGQIKSKQLWRIRSHYWMNQA